MALSQNGRTVPLTAAARSSTLTYIAIPGGKLEVRKGNTATVFQWFATYYNAHVQRLVWPGQWGFFARPIRGMVSGYSNHASGTAIDLNAPLHPRGTKASSNFTKAQVAEIRRMLAYCDGVIRWGAEYVNAPSDPMHFEINASDAAVAALAKKIKTAATGSDTDMLSIVQTSNATPQSAPAGVWTTLALSASGPSATVGPVDIIGGRAYLSIDGLAVGQKVSVRAYLVTSPAKAGEPYVPAGSLGTSVYEGDGTPLTIQHPVIGHAAAGHRVRIQVAPTSPITVNGVTTYLPTQKA